jgi:hypothetical protein
MSASILALIFGAAGAQANPTLIFTITNNSTQKISVVKSPTDAGLSAAPSLYPSSNVGNGGQMTASTTIIASDASGFVYVGLYVGTPYNRNIYCNFYVLAGTLNPDGTLASSPTAYATSTGGESITKPSCQATNPISYNSTTNTYSAQFIFNWS